MRSERIASSIGLPRLLCRRGDSNPQAPKGTGSQPAAYAVPPRRRDTIPDMPMTRDGAKTPTKRRGYDMVYGLASELRAAGMFSTAKEVADCGRLMYYGRKDPAFAHFLKTTAVPMLKERGERRPAAALLRCARIIGRR